MPESPPVTVSQPVAVSDALKALALSGVNLIVVLGLWSPTADQLAAVNAFLAPILLLVGFYLSTRVFGGGAWSPASVYKVDPAAVVRD